MAKPYLGSFEWGEHSNGILSAQNKLKVLQLLAKSQLGQTFSKLGQRLGLDQKNLARLNFDAIKAPDTSVCKTAHMQALTMYSPELMLHCIRTYLFACLFSQYHNQQPDFELLYIGCLLHDAGLAGSNQCQCTSNGFQVVGARYAYDFAVGHAQLAARRVALYESISYHLNPFVPFTDQTVEAALLQRGAMLDVIGLNHHQLGEQLIQRVNKFAPRDGFTKAIVGSMQTIEHAPGSHAHFLGKLGFEKLASTNKIDTMVNSYD
ncbi:MAG: hypothetical protein WEA82_09780 [Idiomarina sp.]